MVLLPALLASSLLALTSPWWEDYDRKDNYVCADQGQLVLERNESQASLISGGQRFTLFRETGDTPFPIYRNEQWRLLLRGDELTLEQLPMKITCVRTEKV